MKDQISYLIVLGPGGSPDLDRSFVQLDLPSYRQTLVPLPLPPNVWRDRFQGRKGAARRAWARLWYKLSSG